VADDVDMAQARDESLLMARIAECRSQAGTAPETAPAVECVDCEEIIPEARREALPGCERCIDCQTDFEVGM
jgi:phage/conjugal plasmid C-4 type zinc finger TraR family protein